MSRYEEIEYLMSKIKQVEFVCPPPRVKVCIRCIQPFFRRTGKALCKCEMPGVEVDYPEQGYTGKLSQFLYILEHDIIPRNIGDQYCHEYQSNIEEIQRRRDFEKQHGLPPLTPEPPDEKMFGVTIEYEPSYKYEPTEPKQSVPKCPICGSTHLSKISALKKAAKIYTFGIFGAGDVGKTYKCENCGAKF